MAAFMAVSVLPGAALATLTWLALRAHYHNALGDAISVRDYLNVWGAGQLIALGRIDILFNPFLYGEWLRSVFGPDLVAHTWSYPPSMAFLTVPLSLLGLVPGFIVWTAGSLAVLWGVLRACRLPLLTCLAVLVSPAVIENALAGQNGALTAAMMEGGLLLVARRPVVAGVLFGLLTTKPQLGILVPVCLVASGRWVTIGVAMATALGLIVASSAAFGVSAWVWYLTDVRQFMTVEILERPFGAGFQKLMATPFILTRWFDATPVAGLCGAGRHHPVLRWHDLGGLAAACGGPEDADGADRVIGPVGDTLRLFVRHDRDRGRRGGVGHHGAGNAFPPARGGLVGLCVELARLGLLDGQRGHAARGVSRSGGRGDLCVAPSVGAGYLIRTTWVLVLLPPLMVQVTL